MDCRTAHTLMREPDPDAPLHDDLALHMAECAACQDDVADPLGRLLAQVSGDVLLPSPQFTTRLLSRLPRTSPQMLAQQAAQRRRWLTVLSLAPVAVLLLALAVGPSFQALWRGATLGVVAEALRQVAGAARWPLVLMVGSVAGVLALIARVLRAPTGRSALGAAGIAAALVIASIGLGVVTDRANAQLAETGGAATIASAIQVTAPAQGNIVSVFGDVTIDQIVDGSVASVFGTVTARAPVAGSVLVGSGGFQGEQALVQGGIVNNFDRLALANVVPRLEGASWSPALVRAVILGAGMVLLVVLLGFTTALWPQPLAQASATLRSHWGTSFGLGTLVASAAVLASGPLLALLAWSVVGLVSLPMLVLVIHLPVVFGLAVVGGMLAQRVFRRMTLQRSLIANVLLLAALLIAALLVPTLGVVLLYVVASAGVGALLLNIKQSAA